MKQRDQSRLTNRIEGDNIVLSRRLALRSSALIVAGLLSDSTFAQTEKAGRETEKRPAQAPKEVQERTEKSKAFLERLRNASGMEDRQQIMHEQMAWQRQRAVEDLKSQLQISDKEWPVVKPRLQAVYDLVHPANQMVRSEPRKTELEQRSRELRELLQGDKAEVDQIKAKLTALRVAKERAAQELSRARQNLRQIMSLRQEAVLVLNALLD